jgi:medium-chain acyl-[acyl-carrier-protein] hydrolase
MEPLVHELADSISAYVEKPYALFGHSMGAAVAFELACELRRRGHREPAHVFASGFRAPHCVSTLPPISTLPDAPFLAEVQQRYGPIAAEVLSAPDLLDLIFRVLRADLTLIERYRAADQPPLECAVTVLGGTDDRSVSVAELQAWARHTTGAFDLTWISGGHFFVRDSRQDVLEVVQQRLQPRRAASAPTFPAPRA